MENLQSTVKHKGGGIMVWSALQHLELNLFLLMGQWTDLSSRHSPTESEENTTKLGLADDFYFQEDNDPNHDTEGKRFNSPIHCCDATKPPYLLSGELCIVQTESFEPEK